MKNSYIYAIALTCLVWFTGCDLLDKYPRDSVNDAVFFKNAEQLELYSNQFYLMLPTASSMFSELSDEVCRTSLTDEVMGTRIVPPDKEDTQWNWEQLRHIHYFMEHLKQCESEQTRVEYEALARFFRAYFYYNKVRYYGDVPWYDHSLGSGELEEINKARDSRFVVMNHVVEDLDFAIANMSSDKKNVYRANKYAAMALKSRVCLFEGTYRKYHGLGDWQNMLTQAANAAKQLMDAKQYELYDVGTNPYRSLFAQNTTIGNEVILARCYNASLGETHNATSYTISTSQGRPGFTKRFVNQYLNADGSRFTDKDGYDLIPVKEEMTNRDPRMEQTVLRPGHYIRVGESEQYPFTMNQSMTGYQIIKYVMNKQYDVYNSSENDMPLFRLAEVYLNYAEALAELGTINQTDIDNSINLLRKRAHMDGRLDMAYANDHPCKYMMSLYPNVNKDYNTGLILEIRRERDVELVLEGFRYWDLMRWKEGKALTLPYYGQAFPKVSTKANPDDGFYELAEDMNLCVWKEEKPEVMFPWLYEFLEVGKDITLSNNNEKGSILCHGTLANPGGNRRFDETKDYLYPLPTQEITLSGGNLKQNPGW